MVKVTLIGCGGLGAALAKGFAESPWVTLTICEKHRDKAEKALPTGGFAFELDPASAVAGADVIVVAVKPAGVASLLESIDASLPEGSLTVSCAAGVSLDTLAAHQQRGALARAMPNTGAAEKASTTAAVLGPRAEEPRDLPRLRGIFGAVGELRMLPSEALMHVATAVGGSGPAFCLRVLEALAAAGVQQGFSAEEADAFARGALRAASALADRGEQSPAELRARITSPQGTTAAGLAVLESAGLQGILGEAVEAAVERSRELSKG